MQTRNTTPLGVLSLTVGLWASASPVAAQGFEGVVTWEMAEGKTAMTQMYKGTQVRVEINQAGQEGVMLMDNTMSSMTMLVPQQKMYMTMDMKGLRGGASADDRTPPKITDTGKSETIAGHPCTVYRYAEAAGKPETMELCAAKGMGFLIMGQSPMGGGGGALGNLAKVGGNPEYAKLYKDGFFPLRISRLEGGSAKMMMVATSIEAKPLDASLFAIPAGYTEMKMGGGARP